MSGLPLRPPRHSFNETLRMSSCFQEVKSPSNIAFFPSPFLSPLTPPPSFPTLSLSFQGWKWSKLSKTTHCAVICCAGLKVLNKTFPRGMIIGKVPASCKASPKGDRSRSRRTSASRTPAATPAPATQAPAPRLTYHGWFTAEDIHKEIVGFAVFIETFFFFRLQ